MLLAHKIELKPNNKQATYFAKGCGLARFAYNWALSEWKKQYQQEQIGTISTTIMSSLPAAKYQQIQQQ